MPSMLRFSFTTLDQDGFATGVLWGRVISEDPICFPLNH